MIRVTLVLSLFCLVTLCTAQIFENSIGLPLSVNQFRSANAVAADGFGNVYAIDQPSNLIKKFSSTGTPLLQWGSLGTEDGQFYYPRGIAVDASGNVYVVEQSRVLKFTNSGTFILKWGGSGSVDGQFNNPTGIAVDASGNVYVADQNNNRIQKFNSTGGFLLKWGSSGSGDGQFSSLTGITVDNSGNVYVADQSRIQKFDSSGAFLLKWGSLGTGDGQLYYPSGLAVDVSGNIYVTEPYISRIQKFSSSGTFLLKRGSYGSGDGQFYNPEGIAVDASNNVYVADRSNNRIQKFNSSGTFLLKWGSYGNGDGQFYNPDGIAVDASGNVYVADANNNRIQKFNSSGTFLLKWGSYGNGDGQFYNPAGIAVDASGNVYVVDETNKRIEKFSNSGTFLFKWGSQGSGDGHFSYPTGIAVDASGNVYVADANNNRIQKFNSSGTFLLKWGSPGSEDGQFSYPTGISIDASGNVYVADQGNSRIQKFDSSGTFLLKLGISGSAGIAVDASGNVYVASSYSIGKFDSNGTFLLGWGGYGPGNGQFGFLRGLVADVSGNVYAADQRNHRIQKFVNLSVNSFSIASGLVDASVTINGTGFSPISTENSVKFNGLASSITSSTATSIIAKVPAGATTGAISVTRQGFTSSSATEFLVLPLTVTSFSPGIGASGSSVNITGTGFSSVSTNNTVKFNGVAATVTSSTATNITAIIPAGNTAGKITVTVNGVTATSVDDFGGTLSITSFTPSNALVDATVTITGTGFSTTPTNQTVKFNGITATVTASALTTLSVKVPSGITTGKISVTRETTTVETTTEFVALPLAINSFSPGVGLTGNIITIEGTGFSSIPSNNSVKFNNVTSSVIPAGTNATTIKVTIPAGATSGKISVTVGDVTATSATDFRVINLIITQTSYPEFFKVGDPGLPVSVTVNNINEVGSVTFKSRGITAFEESIKAETVSISTLSNSIVYQIPATQFNDPLGLYSWFSFLDKEGNEILTEPKHTYLNYSAASQRQLPDLTFGKETRNYNMIAIPFNLTDATVKSVFKILGSYDNRKWRLYELTNGILIEEPKTIVAGKGYWLIAAKEAVIQLGEGSTMKVTKEAPYKVKLNQGVNFIGNPYDFTISWDDVLDHNGLAPELVKIKQYSNGVISTDPLVKRFRGAYIVSDVAREIVIPIVNRSLSGGRIASVAKHSLQHEDWVVNLSVYDGDFRNELFGFGMNKKALETLDIYDDTELPLLPGMSSFDYSFRSFHSKKLTSDIVPTMENYSWESTLNAGRDVTLTWDNSYFGDNDKQLVLENASDVHVVDMRYITQIKLREGAHTLKFHYGDIDYIKEQLIEKESRVGNVYPNPVKKSEGVISVALSLPEGKNEVALELRNSLGVSMTSLQSATYNGGRQTIRWQTNMDQLTQGVYLLRVSIRDTNGVSKNSYQRIILE